MFRGKYQKLTQYIPGVPQKVNAGGALNAPPRGKLLIQNPMADRVKDEEHDMVHIIQICTCGNNL